MSDLSLDATPSTGFYNIIVSGKSFNLSTTALYSDSPNYFTDVFSSPLEESRTKVMFVDRDPEVFKDIVSGKIKSKYCGLKAYHDKLLKIFSRRIYLYLLQLGETFTRLLCNSS
jgi:hypothetical protein